MQFIHESNLSFSSLSNAQLKQNTSKDSLINIAQKINKNIKKDYQKYGFYNQNYLKNKFFELISDSYGFDTTPNLMFLDP